MDAGLSILFKSTSISLITGSTFDENLNNFHEYFIQHSLKSGGTKDHFRQVKVLGITLYWLGINLVYIIFLCREKKKGVW